MKEVLLIAYYFPPLGGAGVQRSAKFAKHLARLGWRVEVVSVVPPRFEPEDVSLLSDIADEAITVYRVPSREAFRWLDAIPGGWRWRSTLQERLLFPDRMRGWYLPALDAASKICAAHPGIAVMTTSAPYTAHLIGLELMHKFHHPWIADFRDEWSMNPYLKFSGWRLERHRAAEREVLENAAAVVGVTETITRQLKSLAPTAHGIFTTVPNGFDPDDLIDLQVRTEVPEAMGQSPVRATPIFTITYAGSLNRERARLIQQFIDCLEKQMREGSLPGQALRLNLVGSERYSNLDLTGRDWITTRGYLFHQEALAWMAGSDLLLLVEPNPAAFTGKIFEYLGLGRAVLGMVHPESPAARLLREAGAGWVVETSSQIEAVIQDCYRAKLAGKRPAEPHPEVVARYNREIQARHLDELLTRITNQSVKCEV